MPIVYRHIRLDTNQPFYIGIGKSEKRAYNKTHHRSEFWHNIVEKTEYEVEILFTDITWEEACKKEKEFIALYGRKDNGTGILCNMTDGGDGGYGVVVKEETKEKIRNYQLSLNKKGKPGRVWTEESKLKLANSIKGIKHTPEAIEKMKKPRVNKANYSYPKNKVACIHCGFLAQPAAIKRWHNNNCKNKNNE
jgi:hypothetical protein